MENKLKLEKLYDSNLSKRKELEKKGTIILNENFDEIIMESIFFKLYEMIHNANIGEIVIYINSNGGDTAALFPLVDLIKGTNKKVNMVVLGKAYSAGALLLLCGTGQRTALEHSEILLHEVATISGYNKTSQIVKDAECIKRINDELKKLIKENTKMTDIQIKRFMDSNIDEFITAKQALKFGIIDKII